MTSVFCIVDDKHVPLYRILWVSELPHFCGDDECLVEGRYDLIETCRDRIRFQTLPDVTVDLTQVW